MKKTRKIHALLEFTLLAVMKYWCRGVRCILAHTSHLMTLAGRLRISSFLRQWLLLMLTLSAVVQGQVYPYRPQGHDHAIQPP